MPCFEALQRRHECCAFGCGETALDTYLQTTARQHADKGISRTFVAVDHAQPQRIIGYFTLTVAEIAPALLLDQQRSRLPDTALPVVKLARLAVDQQSQRRGIGGVLLIEALKRALVAQALTGSIAVVVEAKNSAAMGFYAHYGFVAAPDNTRILFMGFGPIRELLEGA